MNPHTTPQPAAATHALIVIDVQTSFTARPYWSALDLPRYLAKQNELIAGFEASGAPIVRVFHVEHEGPFSTASGLVTPLEGLRAFRDSFTVHKTKHSALAGTALAQWLQENRITQLSISGIRTEQCCETTTRDASDRGFAVNFVSEATLTFEMTHARGRRYSAEEIRERTELVLAGRFAKIQSVEEVLRAL